MAIVGKTYKDFAGMSTLEILLLSRDSIMQMMREARDPTILFGGFRGTGGTGAINILTALPETECHRTIGEIMALLGEQLDLLRLEQAIDEAKVKWAAYLPMC
jgi:hypothetical protein